MNGAEDSVQKYLQAPKYKAKESTSESITKLSHKKTTMRSSGTAKYVPYRHVYK